VELLADRVVHRGQAAVVAHDLGLAEPREGGRAPPAQRLRQLASGPDARLRQPRRRQGGPALLEAQRLRHRGLPSVASTAIRRSMAAGSVTSVQQNSTTALRAGYDRA